MTLKGDVKLKVKLTPCLKNDQRHLINFMRAAESLKICIL